MFVCPFLTLIYVPVLFILLVKAHCHRHTFSAPMNN